MSSPVTSRETAARLLQDAARLRAVRRIVAAGPRSEHLDRLTRLAADLLGDAARAGVPAGRGPVRLEPARRRRRTPTRPARRRAPAADSLCTVTAGLGGAARRRGRPVRRARSRTSRRSRSGQVGAYLGVPLVGGEGQVLGALCVYDDVPRAWTDAGRRRPARAGAERRRRARAAGADRRGRGRRRPAGAGAGGRRHRQLRPRHRHRRARLGRAADPAVRLRPERLPGTPRQLQRPGPPRGPGAGRRGDRARRRHPRRLLLRVPDRAARTAGPAGSRRAAACSGSRRRAAARRRLRQHRAARRPRPARRGCSSR